MSQQPKPRPVVLGLRILVVCLIVGVCELAVAIFWGTDYAKDSDRTLLVMMLAAIVVPTSAIYVIFVLHAGRRRTWARNLLAGWLVVSIASHIYLAIDVGTDWPFNLVEYATTLLEAIGIALLFTREARAWYRSTGVAPSEV